MAEACAGWTDKAGNHHDCQFGDEAADHKFDGKSFCRFHLPMGEPEEGGKADWDNVQQAAITDAIIDRIKAKSLAEFEKPEQQRRQLGFGGVVVPGVFHLDNERTWALDMRGAQFHGDAWFRAAQFHGSAKFQEAQFHGSAMFNKAQFHRFGGVRFDEAQFHGSAMFVKVLFYGHANFPRVLFHGNAWFIEAQFHDHAEFHKVLFHGVAKFREAQFHGFLGVRFDEAQFHADANFDGSTNPAQLEARQFNYTSFHRAHFGGMAIFSNREFRDRTDFSGCVFKRAPNFHGSILHQDTAFGGIECFPDVTSDGADRAYRTLRQAMEGHRARAEEGMFYTLEQKARRRKMRRFDPAYWMSLGYELGSNYGFSVVRPLAWLVGGIFASAFLLLGIGWFGGVSADLATMFNKALLFSVRQMFLPFDALRSTDNILIAYAFNPGGSGWLRVWGVALTLFEALAALLLVLAVRWRYRR